MSVIGYGVPVNKTFTTTGTTPSFSIPQGRVAYCQWTTSYPDGAPSSISAALEVSNDNVNWAPIDSHSSTSNTTKGLFLASRFCRVNMQSLDGTALVSINMLPSGPVEVSNTGSSSDQYRSTFNYDFALEIVAPPTSSQVRINAFHPYTAATKIWIRNIGNDGIDAKNALLLVGLNTTLYVQDKNESQLYGIFDVTGPALDKVGHVEIPVLWKANGGALLGNQAIVLVIVRRT